MHTDLSSHLHTDECNAVIKLLQDCHKNHKFLQFTGYCNHEDYLMRKCLKAERIERQRKNREESETKRAQIKKRVQASENKNIVN